MPLLSGATSQEAQSVAREARNLLQDPDPVTVLVAGLSAAGGIFVAQTVADRVLNFADLNIIGPQADNTATEYAASIGVKTAVALVFAFIAANVTGLPLIATGIMALGALASAGLDLIGGLLATDPIEEFLGDNGSTSASSPQGRSQSDAVTVNAQTSPSASTNGSAEAAPF